MMPINFQKIKKVYLIGIKGSGMSALAELLKKKGIEVMGSDVTDKFFTDKVLDQLDIKYFEGFAQSNIEKVFSLDLVVYSTAYNEENNVEIAWAKKQALPLFSYPQILGFIMQNAFGLAVCGTHGKTTTTAMLALAMRSAGLDLSAIVGSRINQTGSSALAGNSQYFLIEADEYQNKLAFYHPQAVVLTNIDFDHPDYFSSWDEYKKVFAEFIKKIPLNGFLIACAEDAEVVAVAKKAQCKVILYGTFRDEKGNLFQEKLAHLKKEFSAKEPDNFEIYITPEDLVLSVPGKHNLLNATAVLAMAKQLKADEKKFRKALEDFQGTARRFEQLGTYNGAIVIDDYAHHPVEIKATLQAVKERYFNKEIICVFNPHTFSRTKALLDQFSQSFDEADQIIILDIYGSAREKKGEVHSKDLVEKIKKYKSAVTYMPEMETVYTYLKKNLQANQVLITMGAGDVCKIAQRLVKNKL